MEIDLEQVNEIIGRCFPGHAGIRIESLEPGKAVCALDIEPHHHHPGGLAHGGVAYTLADTAMAWAVIGSAGFDSQPITIEQKMTYFEPAMEGEMRCEAVVLRQGRRIVLLEANVTNGKKMVAKSTASFYIRKP